MGIRGSRSAIASEFRGLPRPMAIVPTVGQAEKICVIMRASPVTRLTAVTPTSLLQMRATASTCLSLTMTSTLHHCFAQGLLATDPIAKQAMHGVLAYTDSATLRI